jgi:hypothetical protein
MHRIIASLVGLVAVASVGLGSPDANADVEDLAIRDSRYNAAEFQGDIRYLKKFGSFSLKSEYWRLNSGGFLRFDVTVGNYVYRNNSIDEKSACQIVWGSEKEERVRECVEHDVARLSDGLFVIRDKANSRVCGGIVVFGQSPSYNFESSSHGYDQVSVGIDCLSSPAASPEAAVASAIRLLERVKKDGRHIFSAVGVEGLQPFTRSVQTPSHAEARRDSAGSGLSDSELCLKAIQTDSGGKRRWDGRSLYKPYVEEAKRRGLDCGVGEHTDGTPSQTAAADPAAVLVLPIAYRWDGVSDVSIGRLRIYDNDRRSGAMDVEGGDVVGRCSGRWQLRDAGVGTWHLTCAKNVSASGVYRMTDGDSGAGEGVDTEGREISFKIGY